MNKLILILLTFITSLCYSQTRDTITTISDGSWGNTSNWDTGVAPDNDQTNNTDDLIITHNITLTDALSLKGGTTLTIEGCDTLTINGDVSFANGSMLVVEDCAALIINGNVTNNNNSTDVEIDGYIIINGNFTGGNGSALIGDGVMEITGTVTTDGSGTVFGSDTDCTVDGTCDNTSGCNLDCGTLPIELLHFDCYFYSNVITVEWSTASEINNDYFEINKSYDGYEWFVLGVINGSGNSSITQYYSYYDNTVIKENNYFKLIQIDFDGEFSESNIINCDITPKIIINIEMCDIFGRSVYDTNQTGIIIIIEEYKDGSVIFKKRYK